MLRLEYNVETNRFRLAYDHTHAPQIESTMKLKTDPRLSEISIFGLRLQFMLGTPSELQPMYRTFRPSPPVIDSTHR